MARAPWTQTVAITLLMACGPAEVDDPSDPIDTTDPIDPVDSAVADTDAAVDPPSEGLNGRLVGPDGGGLGGEDVLACTSTFCLYGETDAAGRFVFTFDEPARVALKTHADLDATPRRAAALRPCVLVDVSPQDVGDVYVPALPAGAPIGSAWSEPQTLAAGDGVELTLQRSSLRPAFGDSLVDVAAARLPADRVPPLPDLDGEEVLAVFALHPFAATSTTPIGVRLPADLSPDGPVKLRTISELDGQLSAPVAATSDGAGLVTAVGEGLERLTYLVVSR
jgi:hypothetical protein